MPVKFAVAPDVKKRGKGRDLKSKSLKDCADSIGQFWRNVNKDENGLEFETGQVNFESLVNRENNKHELINAVMTAYNEHFPLILSPDDFWLLIALAVSTFLGSDKETAEKYRSVFVEHEEKKTLYIRGDPFGISPKSPKSNKEGWPQFVEEICKLVAKETKTEISELLTKPFSTSGPIERTAFGVCLMESMKNYFHYKCGTLCGIPEIVLEGTPEDYMSILERIKALKSILPDFQWHLDRVEKRMEKIHESSLGNVDQDFWRSMVKVQFEASGDDTFTGWLSDFIAYWNNFNEQQFPNNPEVHPAANNMSFGLCSRPAVTFTDFIFEDGIYTMKEYKMKLVAGFMGMAKVESKLLGGVAVRPVIGWMTFYLKDDAEEAESEKIPILKRSKEICAVC